MFNLSPFTLVALALIALFLYGPDKLPTMVGDAARNLRRLRGMLRDASEGVRKELGPEFQDVQLSDLNPRAFVRKHLLEDEEPDSAPKPSYVHNPKPEGWPENVPYPSAADMGMNVGDDPFTTEIPRENFRIFEHRAAAEAKRREEQAAAEARERAAAEQAAAEEPAEARAPGALSLAKEPAATAARSTEAPDAAEAAPTEEPVSTGALTPAGEGGGRPRESARPQA